MKIYVPSKGRHTSVADGPLADLPASILTYVVPEEEWDDYRRVLPPETSIMTTTREYAGIARTRRFIGETAHRDGYDTFIMLDDDIRFLVRRGSHDWRLRGTEITEAMMCMDQVERLLRAGFAHVGVSAREGNNRIGVGGMFTLYAENTRTLRALAYRTKDFLSVEHGRVEVMEDFDVNLQLLRRGRPNANVGFWAQGQKMTNAPGGCSTYRSHEVHERSAHRLAELHPGLVRLRQKQNKTDRDGFGTRTEVTISWKKAYEGSL